MTPLQRIAMGLVIVVLDTQTPWDLLPDVLGWLLVLAGVTVLPVPDRGTLRTSAVVAALVSVVVYPPQVHEPLAAACRTSPSPSSSPGAWAGWPRRRATVARPAGCGCC